MSYIEVFVVQENGDVVSYSDEARNNYSWAPLIWSVFGKKYGYVSSVPYPYSEREGLDRFWNEWPSPKMTRAELILIGASFDFVWVTKELVPELVEANKMFYADHVKPNNWDNRGVLGVIKALDDLQKEIPDYRGVAFNACSAISPFWNVRLEDDEEGDYETRPWNIDKDVAQPSGEYKGKKAWELKLHMDAYLEKNWVESQPEMLRQQLWFENALMLPIGHMSTRQLEELLVKLDVRLREEEKPTFDVGLWLKVINKELARRV